MPLSFGVQVFQEEKESARFEARQKKQEAQSLQEIGNPEESLLCEYLP